MNITTAVIGLGMLALFVIPAIILTAKNRNRNKGLLIELTRLAALQNCELSAYDVQPQFAIGLSVSGNQIFFISRQDKTGELIKNNILINRLKACNLQTKKRTVNLQKSTETVIDKIEINFHSRDKDNGNSPWVLYDSEVTPHPDGELLLGEKWVSIINKAI